MAVEVTEKNKQRRKKESNEEKRRSGVNQVLLEARESRSRSTHFGQRPKGVRSSVCVGRAWNVAWPGSTNLDLVETRERWFVGVLMAYIIHVRGSIRSSKFSVALPGRELQLNS